MGTFSLEMDRGMRLAGPARMSRSFSFFLSLRFFGGGGGGATLPQPSLVERGESTGRRAREACAGNLASTPPRNGGAGLPKSAIADSGTLLSS